MIFLALCSVLLTGAAAAIPRTSDFEPRTTVEKRSASFHWKRSLDGPEPSHMLPLSIGLAQQNLHTLDDQLLRVSSPSSEHYAAYWSPQEIAEYFAPSHDSVKSVQTWLEDHAIELKRQRLSQTRGWIHANVSVAEAERLLQTKYYKLSHTKHGRERLACDEYSVPSSIREHIDFIMPTIPYETIGSEINEIHANRLEKHTQAANMKQHLDKRSQHLVNGPDSPKHESYAGIEAPFHPNYKLGGIIDHLFHHKEGDVDQCWEKITPDCIDALYNIPKWLRQKEKHHDESHPALGVVEFYPQIFNQSDIDIFLRQLRPKLEGTKPQVIHIDNTNTTNAGSDYNLESNLDLMYAIAVGNPLKPVIYEVGNNNDGSFNNFLDGLDGSYCTKDGGDSPLYDTIFDNPTCGGVPVAKVISMSYSSNEASMSHAYLNRQCNEWGKLSLAGTTFLVSSGDDGVGSFDTCLEKDSTYPNKTMYAGRFAPQFPVSCPYVTGIGATEMIPFSNVHDNEQACENVIFSGGGFSNHFAAPSWQKPRLDAYHTAFNPGYSDLVYNNTRQARGIPDISANGANYVVTIGGKNNLVYGTSASAPVIASIIALINTARENIGKKPVGFINPALYSAEFSLAHRDIASGTNPGCGTKGFDAVPGWDPVTGLGTPNVEAWAGIWLSLP